MLSNKNKVSLPKSKESALIIAAIWAKYGKEKYQFKFKK